MRLWPIMLQGRHQLLVMSAEALRAFGARDELVDDDVRLRPVRLEIRVEPEGRHVLVVQPGDADRLGPDFQGLEDFPTPTRNLIERLLAMREQRLAADMMTRLPGLGPEFEGELLGMLEGPSAIHGPDPGPPPEPVAASSFDEWQRKTAKLIEDNNRVAELRAELRERDGT